MSYVGTCTRCYRQYLNRRHFGTYCLRCRIRTIRRYWRMELPRAGGGGV